MRGGALSVVLHVRNGHTYRETYGQHCDIETDSRRGRNAVNGTEKILKLQKLSKQCSHVFVVNVKCEDEISIDAIYGTLKAAELHRDSVNKRPSYYGRAYITPMAVRTDEMADLLFRPSQGEIPSE
jgi:hypothetical protein